MIRNIENDLTLAKNEINGLKDAYNRLKVAFGEKYPNHCRHCDGKGRYDIEISNEQSFYPTTRNVECINCLAEAFNPLDINVHMTELQVEVFNAKRDMNYPFNDERDDCEKIMKEIAILQNTIEQLYEWKLALIEEHNIRNASEDEEKSNIEY